MRRSDGTWRGAVRAELARVGVFFRRCQRLRSHLRVKLRQRAHFTSATPPLTRSRAGAEQHSVGHGGAGPVGGAKSASTAEGATVEGRAAKSERRWARSGVAVVGVVGEADDGGDEWSGPGCIAQLLGGDPGRAACLRRQTHTRKPSFLFRAAARYASRHHTPLALAPTTKDSSLSLCVCSVPPVIYSYTLHLAAVFAALALVPPPASRLPPIKRFAPILHALTITCRNPHSQLFVDAELAIICALPNSKELYRCRHERRARAARPRATSPMPNKQQINIRFDRFSK